MSGSAIRAFSQVDRPYHTGRGCSRTKVKLFKGKVNVAGRKSEFSLYSKKLATYETGDVFDHDAAKGFILAAWTVAENAGAEAVIEGWTWFLSAGGCCGMKSKVRHEDFIA